MTYLISPLFQFFFFKVIAHNLSSDKRKQLIQEALFCSGFPGQVEPVLFALTASGVLTG